MFLPSLCYSRVFFASLKTSFEIFMTALFRTDKGIGILDGKDGRMSKEIELKLDVEPGAIGLVPGLPLLAGAVCRHAVLTSVYYDTSNRTLGRKGYSLRVRTVGQRFIQTVKYSSGSGGLFTRDEWEWEVASLEPEMARLSELPKNPLIRADKRGNKMETLFRSEVTRTSWRIEVGDSEIQVDLDDGALVAGGTSRPISEVELELVTGDPKDVLVAARTLAQQVTARPGVLSKAELGFAVVDGTLERAIKAARVNVVRSMTVAEAFATIVNACLKHYRLNEALVLAGRNAEALHQCRVAMRRLRSALTFFKSAVADEEYPILRENLRWFTNELGDARNLDVYLERDLSQGERRKLLKKRDATYDLVIEAMDSVKFRVLLIDLIGWIALGSWRMRKSAGMKIGAFAGKRLDRLWGTIKPAGLSLSRMDETARHELRIQVKKMRYAVEFFSDVYPDSKRKAQFVAEIERLQEALGKLNDLVTARSLTHGEFDEWWVEQSDEIRHLKPSDRALRKLGDAGPFWRC